MRRTTPRRALRRDRQRAVREADILAAARSLIAEKGYEAATMDAIARRAEYTKRTVYAYFPSKEELALALVEEALRGLVRRFESAAGAGGRGAERISRIGNAYLDLYRSDPAGFRILNLHAALPPAVIAGPRFDRVRRLDGQVQKLVADAFAAGVADRSVRKGVDPRRAALFVTTVTNGILQRVTEQGAYFERLHGFPAEDFIADGMRMIGASFLAGPVLP